MNQNELTEPVRQLIHSSVPSIDAMQVLIALLRQPGRWWTLQELFETFGSTALGEPELREYLALLRAQGIATERAGGEVGYQPTPGPLEPALAGLLKAYDERPVTLIRTVYAIADAKRIQVFADAFKIKKDE